MSANQIPRAIAATVSIAVLNGAIDKVGDSRSGQRAADILSEVSKVVKNFSAGGQTPDDALDDITHLSPCVSDDTQESIWTAFHACMAVRLIINQSN